MACLKKFIKQNLHWEDIVKVPKPYFVEDSVVGKIIRKLSTIGNHTAHNGHGLHISCKIVLPTYCQAKCDFCFNNVTWETQTHDTKQFLRNLYDSLDTIFKHIGKRKISFDITGNEPTFDLTLLHKTLAILQHFRFKYHESFKKVVLTTNGYKLKDWLVHDVTPVDYINLSLHSPIYDERVRIFKTTRIPDNSQIQEINRIAQVPITAVAVVHAPVNYFEGFVCNFAYEAQRLGFSDTRIRIDYKGNVETRDQFFDNFKNVPIDICPGLMTKNIKFDGLNPTNIYLGVKDLTEFVIGSEVIIDDDGRLYLDYSKRYLLENYGITKEVLNMLYWNPKIWWDENKLRNRPIK